MKKLLPLIIFLAIISNVMAQEIPNGFNYQAVVRDDAGNIISNEETIFELSIQDDIGTEIWTETHTITTNQFGLVSLVVGQGTKTGGTAVVFSDIDWSAGAMKLHTVITYNSENIDMGTSEIWSIPYSMVSKNAYTALEAVNAQSATTATNAVNAENAINAQNATLAQNAVNSQTALTALTADVAYDLVGDLSSLNVVEDPTGIGEEPLFEVKNNTGQTVFAVYNEGVEVYFDDSEPKGIKGSFVVRGFSTGKEDENDYLFVNRDSARIYLNNDTTSKGIKGSFAVGSFYTPGMKAPANEYLRITEDSSRIYINDVPEGVKGIKGSFAVQGFKNIDKGEGNNYFDINMDESGSVIDPGENRILWYPYSNALLAGKVLVEDPANVGENSFVTGYESRAKGNFSQAMGYQAYADGLNSTSIGQNSLAVGDNSYAIGQGAEVLAASGYAIGMNATVETEGAYGYALGHKAIARAASSYAIGDSAQAYGMESYAIGRGAIASGTGSFAFGSAGLDSLNNATEFVQAMGGHSVAIGQGAKATSEGSVAIGVGNEATERYSTALGYKTISSGYGSYTTGSRTTASHWYSTAMGNFTTASGYASTAMGRSTMASGQTSTTMGYRTTASGSTSTAMGYSTNASGEFSTAMGYYTTAFGNYSTAMGYYTSSGPASTAMGNHSEASGMFSTAIGEYVTAPSYGEVVLGTFNTNYTPSGIYTRNNSDRLFVIGNGTSTTERNDALIILKNGTTYFNGILNPYTNNVYSLGSSSYRWTTVYATNGTINTSDARYKTNIQTIENPIDKIMGINGIRYNWNSNEYPDMNFDNDTHLGVLAQEVEEVLPELVFTDENGYKSVSYEKLTPVLIEAVKEQQEEITELKARLEALERILGI
jgi:hypothetical protein